MDISSFISNFVHIENNKKYITLYHINNGNSTSLRLYDDLTCKILKNGLLNKPDINQSIKMNQVIDKLLDKQYITEYYNLYKIQKDILISNLDYATSLIIGNCIDKEMLYWSTSLRYNRKKYQCVPLQYEAIIFSDYLPSRYGHMIRYLWQTQLYTIIENLFEKNLKLNFTDKSNYKIVENILYNNIIVLLKFTECGNIDKKYFDYPASIQEIKNMKQMKKYLLFNGLISKKCKLKIRLDRIKEMIDKSFEIDTQVSLMDFCHNIFMINS